MRPHRVVQFGARATFALSLVLGTVALGAGVAMAAAAPGAVTGSVSSITPTTAIVNGSVTANGATTSWYFQYGTTTAYGAKSPTDTTKGSASVAETLGGLTPATSYHYRLVATNSFGTTLGADGLFSTNSVPNVVTQPTSNLTATTATLNAIVNAEGQTTSTFFEYGATTKVSSKTPTKSVPAGAGNIAVVAVVTGLKPSTKYYYRVYAKNAAGASVGTILSFTTGLSITLNANSYAVIFGGPVTLSGVVASGLPGVSVTVFARRFDQGAFSAIATVATGPGGLWSYATAPTARTTFEVSGNGGTSSPIEIGVRPKVTLVVLSGGRLQTKVVGYVSFAHRILQLQRLSHGTWVTVKREAMDATGKAIFMDSLLPIGRWQIRTAIGPDVLGIDQAAPGLLAGYSAPRVYVRR